MEGVEMIKCFEFDLNENLLSELVKFAELNKMFIIVDVWLVAKAFQIVSVLKKVKTFNWIVQLAIYLLFHVI